MVIMPVAKRYLMNCWLYPEPILEQHNTPSNFSNSQGVCKCILLCIFNQILVTLEIRANCTENRTASMAEGVQGIFQENCMWSKWKVKPTIFHTSLQTGYGNWHIVEKTKR